MRDGFDLDLTTSSAQARDAYADAVTRYLAYDGGVREAFEAAIAADETLALGHLAIARYEQLWGNRDKVAAPLARARALAERASAREQSQINMYSLMMAGKSPEALTAARAHLAQWPRDAMVAQPCTGVFGLIGFSGAPGREAEQLAFTTLLEPHCGGDWWFQAQHGFAQLEVGQLGSAETTLNRAIEGNPRSANTAHIRAHLYYENGEADAGRAYLDGWMPDYAQDGLMYCHISWHQALWALERGDEDAMWALIDAEIAPGLKGPPLNVMTDLAAILYRAELAGVSVAPERWVRVSTYALDHFPNPGLGFADAHAALAHAMAGNTEALHRIAEAGAGPAGEVVRDLALSFEALAAQDWRLGARLLRNAMQDHARIGGSRAQRDLLEFALAAALIRQGHGREARHILALHRPRTTPANSVVGLADGG